MPRRTSSCWLLLAACSGAPSGASKPEDAKADPVAKSDPVAKADPVATSDPVARSRERCAADSECLASCRHGAVSRAWHIATYPGGEACEDGCTAKGTDPPRCEQGRCVAYRAGARDPQCTALDVEPIAGPGPAHRCNTDGECTLSCEHGAVNQQWLSWQRPSECGDGCTSPGHEPPRCEDGRCVAYRGGKPHAACTERPAAR